jgi:hypothetical protein
VLIVCDLPPVLIRQPARALDRQRDLQEKRVIRTGRCFDGFSRPLIEGGALLK